MNAYGGLVRELADEDRLLGGVVDGGDPRSGRAAGLAGAGVGVDGDHVVVLARSPEDSLGRCADEPHAQEHVVRIESPDRCWTTHHGW